MKLNKDYAELLCIIFFFKKGSQTEKKKKMRLSHTYLWKKPDTESTKTKCLELRYQGQMPHQNKMKDSRGKFYNSATVVQTLDKGGGSYHFQTSLPNQCLISKPQCSRVKAFMVEGFGFRTCRQNWASQSKIIQK